MTEYTNPLVLEISNLKDEKEELIKALHAAIKCPMGVVPEIADSFYHPEEYYDALGNVNLAHHRKD